MFVSAPRLFFYVLYFMIYTGDVSNGCLTLNIPGQSQKLLSGLKSVHCHFLWLNDLLLRDIKALIRKPGIIILISLVCSAE